MEALFENASRYSSEIGTFVSAVDAIMNDINRCEPSVVELREEVNTWSEHSNGQLTSEEDTRISSDEQISFSNSDDMGIMDPLGRSDLFTEVCLMDAVLNKKFRLEGVEVEQNGICSALKCISCPLNPRTPLGGSTEYRTRTLSANGICLVQVPETRTAQSWVEYSQPSPQKGNPGKAMKRVMKTMWTKVTRAFRYQKLTK